MTTIRPARPEDRAALVEQFGALNRFEQTFARNRRTDPDGAAESLDSATARAAETGGVVLVAEEDGVVVGHLVLTFETDGAYVREQLRPYAYVLDLFVRDAARGRGVGTALLLEAERIAAASGVPRLLVGVLAGNEGAARLYERNGFARHSMELEKRLGQA